MKKILLTSCIILFAFPASAVATTSSTRNAIHEVKKTLRDEYYGSEFSPYELRCHRVTTSRYRCNFNGFYSRRQPSYCNYSGNANVIFYRYSAEVTIHFIYNGSWSRQCAEKEF